MPALPAEHLDARGRGRIQAVRTIDREAVPAKPHIWQPIRPLRHDLIRDEVALVPHRPVGLDVEGQDVLAAVLGKIGT
jgi:hypothetical protein